ncbi:MAG TPA: hypothetical protein VF619_04465 [Allosphingosinicella sp.]|jgi:hypothetical protein
MTQSNSSDGNGTGFAEAPVDGCVEAIELGELEATQDFELPPARGGVEQPLPTQS